MQLRNGISFVFAFSALVACATGAEPDRAGPLFDAGVGGSNTGGGAAFGSGGTGKGATGGIGGASGVGGSTGGGSGSDGSAASGGNAGSGGSAGNAGAQGAQGSSGAQGSGGSSGTGGSQGVGGGSGTGAVVDGGGALRVQYRHDSGTPTDSAIQPQIQIHNTGSAPANASELKLRYYYTIDSGSQTQQFACDWSKVISNNNDCSMVTNNFGSITGAKTDRYLEIGFNMGSIAAGAFAELHLRFNKSDQASFDETNDYSYGPSQTGWGEWQYVTLYQNGTLIWGAEP